MILEKAQSQILDVIEPRLREAERHRTNLNSWRYCYDMFNVDATPRETLALQLGFFLASWGMMRGSSFLRKFDHLVHLPVIDIVRSSSARKLREKSVTAMVEIADIIAVKDAIAGAYALLATDGETINISDTLSSKIMLATLGCVPAYDRFFVAGARSLSIPGRFNANSLAEIQKHIDLRAAEYAEARRVVERRLGCDIPLMRIVDMYFFTIGVSKGSMSQSSDLPN